MRESDVPPPGDPSTRGSGFWAAVFIALIAVFILWFAIRNWGASEPGDDLRSSTLQGER